MAKRIAFKKGTTAVEELPYPRVFYPGHYGAFFAFAQSVEGPLYLCSCSMVAVENYVQHRTDGEVPRNSDLTKMFVLSSSLFPIRLVNRLMSDGVKSNSDVLSHLRFENKLCHECNKATPSYRYCHEMYGTKFKQTYGWYIKKQANEWGVYGTQLVEESCPQEVLDLIDIPPDEYYQFRNYLIDNGKRDEARKITKKYNKQRKRVNKLVENEVRQKFGHSKIGEAWTSETILYYIVKKLFPDNEIKRHHRPDYLEGLELDIFIPELNVGIEYQGIQHYKPVKHWGGKNALKRTKERDKLKRELCNQLDIHLVYFRYNEELCNEMVRDKLDDYL